MKPQNTEQKSRTEYSMMNTSIGLIFKLMAILMGFVTRVVFTRTLSEGYVGINGLFTDIIYILSLSELGVGTAITFALYEPIANHDIEKQQILMRIYKQFYRITALIVAVIGLLLIPFLGIIMKDRPDVNHITLIYLLYLSNSVLSYLMVYRKTLIEAHQLSYITLSYQNLFYVIQDILQIIILLTTKNFILFLIMANLCTLAFNITITRKANQLYPYLKEKNTAKLPKEERNSLIQNIKALILNRVGTIAINNTDNIIISAFVGVLSAGSYSQYYLIIGSIRQILEQIFNGIAASVGNLGVEEDQKTVRHIFDLTFFIGQWLYGFSAICLFVLLNPFIEGTFGKSYLFPLPVVFVLCLNFYLVGTRKAGIIFKESLGLFWSDRYRPLVEAALNLFFSILFVIKLGLIGVFLGTALSNLLTSMWMEPYILFRKKLGPGLPAFFLRSLLYFGVTLFTGGIIFRLCSLISTSSWLLTFLLHLIVCVLGTNLVFLAFYGWTRYFKETWRILSNFIKKKLENRRLVINDKE